MITRPVSAGETKDKRVIRVVGKVAVQEHGN